MGYTDFDGFIEAVKNHVLTLEPSGTTVSVRFIERPGARYTGLTVTPPNSHLSKVINLEDLYGYGATWRSQLEEILAITPPSVMMDVDFLDDYEQVKTKLTVHVLPTAKVPASVISSEIDNTGLSNVPYLDFGETDGSRAGASIPTTSLNTWNVTADQVIRDAYANTARLFPPAVAPIGETLKEMDPYLDVEDDPISPVLVVSNVAKYYGAASLFQPGMFEKISARLGSESFWLVPSSVHEWLAMNSSIGDSEWLRSTIREVNASAVTPNEYLADDPFWYDAKNGFLRISD